MKKEAYDKFMKKISSEFKNVDTVKEFLLDAAELAMYGDCLLYTSDAADE